MKQHKAQHNADTIKLGDFVCISEPSAYCYNMDWPSAQAIGKVIEIGDWNKYTLEFPERIGRVPGTLGYFPEEVRKASAYEGMMAFWDPEEENERFFGGKEIEVVDPHWKAAHAKVKQSNLSVEDF